MAAYGWPNSYAYRFGSGCNSQANPVFPPPPPPGYGWFDTGAIAPQYPVRAQWGMPGCTPNHNMNAWNRYFSIGQNSVMPNMANVNDGGIPGMYYHNTHGGVGLDPGYTYLYPKEHCKIHVILSDTPPWQNNGPYSKRCFEVPTGITVKDLMQQFGCTNLEAAKNKLYEVTQGSDGRWYKGYEVDGSDKENMEKKIEEVGWNGKRNGIDQDYVWLYFTKD